MSVANGERIVKVQPKGRVVFEFVAGEKAFRLRVDVMQTYNAWQEIDRQFRGADGKVPVEQWSALDEEVWNFTRKLFAESANLPVQIPQGFTPTPDQQNALEAIAGLSLASAKEFITMLVDEVETLIPFFRPKSAEKPSSAESTELRFST